MLTERENYLRMLRGEHPEWVPVSRFGKSKIDGSPPPTQGVLCSPLFGHMAVPGKAVDIWGVTFVSSEEAAGGKLPEPNNFILKDICDWGDVIKAPDPDDIDWEAAAKKDLARVNREESVVVLHTFNGLFQTLVSFMGFEGALMAMLTDPDEVKELFEYLTNFYVTCYEKLLDHYKPDVMGFCEDNAAWKSPFFSLEMYRDLYKPFTKRLAQPVLDRGIFIDMHNCGHCEIFVDEWQDYDVRSWNPAQSCNDVLGIKKRYGRKLVIIGGSDFSGEMLEPDYPEEKIKEAVIRTIDTFAPGGAYVFAGGFLGPIGDEVTARKNRWISEAAEPYCRDFYKTHG